MKNIENFIINIEPPLTTFMIDNIISEDSKNKSIRVYDKNLFKNLKLFKINMSNNEEEKENEEKERKEEIRRKEYQDTLRRIDNISSEIESHTNQIKRDMEIDVEKRKEMERLEKLRIERERKEREEKERIERERIQREKEEKEKRDKAERERKEKERIQIEKDRIKNLGTIKNKLIKAANNFENIRKEVQIINDDKSKEKIINKIILNINDLVPNITTNKDLKEEKSSGKELKKILKELKDDNQKEFFIYSCYLILAEIKKILTSSSLNYKDSYIKAKLISFLDSKTLTYMFFQNMSNSCPFIIPVKNYKSLFTDENLASEKENYFKRNRKENINKFIIYEYLYFSFLFIDINKNIDILDDFLKNMEAFQEKDINYLIGSSFSSFINVFGYYIKTNKNIWFTRIQNLMNKVMKALNVEREKTKRADIKNIIDKINNDLEDYLKLLKENKKTKYVKEIENLI